MTWPMHDAGSTTPEPDSGEPELSERGAGQGRTPPPTRCHPWTARCRAAVRARPRRRCRWRSSGRPDLPGLSGPPGLPRQVRPARPDRWTRRRAGAGCPGRTATGRPMICGRGIRSRDTRPSQEPPAHRAALGDPAGLGDPAACGRPGRPASAPRRHRAWSVPVSAWRSAPWCPGAPASCAPWC